MSSTLRNLHLLDYCAPSFSYDRQVQAACEALDRQLHEIIDVTDGAAAVPAVDAPAPPAGVLSAIIFISQIMKLSDVKLVDILAWQFHVDFYDPTKPLSLKKQLVQNSIQWHHRKGTVALLQEVLDLFWPGGATIIEWFEYMDPLPPNYPIDDPDVLRVTFNPSNVNITLDRFEVTAHGLTNNTQIRFLPTFSFGSELPAPLTAGVWYSVVNAAANTFQVARPTHGGDSPLGNPPINLTSTGSGSNQIFSKGGGGTWHDRYRFRVIIDEDIITPADEAAVLELINAYKPVSRWLDGFFRAIVSEAHIGTISATLRFVYHITEAPDYTPEPEAEL